MSNKLLTKAAFARLAGVHPSAVTRACASFLKGATQGNMVDADHPDALDYVERQVRAKTPGLVESIDTLYESALAHCRETGRWTASSIQRSQRVGYNRAARMLEVMVAAGVIPADVTPTSPPPEPAPKPPLPKPAAPPRPRGWVAKKENEKREAAASAPAPIEIPSDLSVFYDMKLVDIVAIYGTDARFVDWLNSVQKIEAINEKRLKNATTEGKLVSRDLVQSGVLDNIDASFVRMLTDGRQTISNRAHSIANAGGSAEDVDSVVGDLLQSFIAPAKKKIQSVLQNA